MSLEAIPITTRGVLIQPNLSLHEGPCVENFRILLVQSGGSMERTYYWLSSHPAVSVNAAWQLEFHLFVLRHCPARHHIAGT